MNRFLDALLKHYKWLMAFSVVLAVFCTYLIFKIEVDNSIRIWFVEDSPEIKAFESFQKKYGNDELATALITSQESVFKKGNLEKLIACENDLKKISFVENVYTIASSPFLAQSMVGIKPEKIVESIPQNEEEEENIRYRANDFKPLRKTLVSADEKSYFIIIRMKKFNEVESIREQVVTALRKTLDKHYNDYALGGLSAINEATNTTISNETVRSTLVSSLLVILLLSLYVRKRRFIFIVIAGVTLPLFFMGGLFVFFGFKMNLLSTIIPTLVLVSGISDTVHILNLYNYFGKNETGLSKEELIKKTIRYSFLPCMLTSVTTMAGFLAIYLSPMPAIRETGLFAGIGMGVEVICAYIVCICGFMLLKNPEEEKEWKPVKVFIDFHNSIMSRVTKITRQHMPVIVIFFSIILITSLVLVWKIEVNTYNIEYLSKQSQARKDHERIEKTMGGYLRFEMVVSAEKNASVISHQKLNALYRFERYCEEKELFENTFSVADLVRHINKKTTGFSGFTSPLFSNADMLKNFWYKEKQVQELADSNFTEVRISGTIKMKSSKEYEEVMKKCGAYFKEQVPDSLGLSLSIQGYAPLYVLMNQYIVDSQTKSFVGSFLLVFLPFFLFYKSGRITLLAIFSNIIPIASVVLMMFFRSIPLDNGSAMISAIILGIAVNNTIHFTNMYLRERKRGLSNEEAVDSSLMITGNAIISSSVTVFIGFLVIASSSVSTLSSFGILCGLAVLMAMFSDLLLMPSLTKMKK